MNGSNSKTVKEDKEAGDVIGSHGVGQEQEHRVSSQSILSGAMMMMMTMKEKREGEMEQGDQEQTSGSALQRRRSSSTTQAVVASFFKHSLKELSHDWALLEEEPLHDSAEAAAAAGDATTSASTAAAAAAVSTRSNSDNNSTMMIKINRRKRQQAILLEKAFDVIDVSKLGYLTSDDLFIFFQQAAQHIGLRQVEDELIDIAVDALLEDIATASALSSTAASAAPAATWTADNANQNGDNDDAAAATHRHITKEQFFDIFDRHPDLMTAFGNDMSKSTLAFYDRHQSQQSSHHYSDVDHEQHEQLISEWQENAQVFHRYNTELQNRAVEYAWLVVYVATSIGILTQKAIQYAHHQAALDVFGYCILPARGAAACLNLNCLLILLPICRHLTTWVQCTPLAWYFPFNAYLEAHILFGTAILLWSMVHVGAHVCDFYRFAYAPEEAIYALFGDKLGVVPMDPTARVKLLLQQPAAITGIIMVICILIAYPVVLVRRTKFNTFWILHHLLLIMLIALCCHGIASLLEPFQSVYYVIGPLVIYVASKVLRETKLSDTKVVLVQTKSGGIVHLQLKKPLGWKHVRSGMYAFLKVPHVSNIEWHPFTLTSTPDDPYLEFHFAAVGDWTDAVQTYLSEQIQATKHENGGEEGDCGVGPVTSLSLDTLQFKVDGPMGASSQGFMDFEVVVLVGAGKGLLCSWQFLPDLQSAALFSSRVFVLVCIYLFH
jgi:hypothetical protein